MALLLPLVAFVFASVLVGAAAMKFMPRSAGTIDRRLGEVTGTFGQSHVDSSADFERVATDTLKRLANVAPRSSASERSKLQLRLVNAGFRGTEALVTFAGIRVATALLAFILVATPIVMRPNFMLALIACAFGYILPNMVLARLARARQHRIRLSLPDALDLLVVSVEAGLGLDQALQRVGHELEYAHPDLCEELRLINLELRAGKGRADALHNLAERTGVDDVASLAAMLVQTDKFGTSVAQSLRVHSETLRTKRRQRAEEAAAKTGVKMVFPLVICIFPAVWVVTIGPAAIKFIQVLGPLAGETLMQTAVVSPPQSAPVQAPPAPRGPASIEETGLTTDQLCQLFLKTLYTGEATGVAVADRMRLPYGLLEPLVEGMRAERLIEVRGAAGSGSAAYRYALTDLGRDRARQYFDANQYVGAAPVPLDRYIQHVKAMQAARGYIDRDRLRAGFSHLVVDDGLFDQLGPAVNAAKAVFLYGPPGNGKTVLAEGMGRALGGDLYVPHAIDVGGQIITVFDPIVHEAVPDDEEILGSVIKSVPRDRRWIRIRRPVVIVGGELTLEMLDLTFNPISKFHEAPLQMKANGGVLLVDDFGRQRMRPEDLLNRWIVPLESRVDYLALHTGKKIQVPFDVLIAFATNLDPLSLADEAFLRRIPYKIEVTDPSIVLFTQIFEMNCRRRRLPFHKVLVAYLQRRHYLPYGRPMRACHPRDILDQVAALCRYRGQEPAITRELLDEACRAYFLDTDSTSATTQVPKARRPSIEVH